jgi:hypothetical protein
MKKIQTLVVLVFMAGQLFAQPAIFQRTYGGSGIDEGRCVRQTYDRGYILLGSTTSFGAGLSDIYLLKVDSVGNPQWGKTFGGSSIDKGYSLEITSDSGFIFCGYTNSFGSGGYDFYVVRTDSLGNSIWEKTFGGTDWDFANSVKQTSDGGFVVMGDSYSGPTGFRNPLVIKTNNTGDVQWQKNLSSLNDEYSNAFGITTDDQYVIVGYSVQSRTNSEDITVHKVSTSGDSLWTKFVGDTSAEKAFAVSMYPDNGFAIVGSNRDSANLNNLTVRFNSSGDSVWYRKLNPPLNDVTYDITTTSDGNFVLTGYTDSYGAGAKDFFITKIDSGTGDVVPWLLGKTYGGSGDDIAYSVRQTIDGGYILFGSTASYAPGPEAVYLIKVDSMFNTTSTVVIGIDEVNTVLSKNAFVYPNPTTDFLTIGLNKKTVEKNRLNFELYNLIGKKILAENIFPNEEFNINRKTIQAAAYFYRIIEENSNQLLASGILILR